MAGWPPEKSVAFNAYVVIRDADGDPITDPTGLAALISRDGGSETTATNTPAVVNTGAATVQLTLTAAEMSADEVTMLVSSTSSGAKDAFQAIYTDSKQIGDLLTTADVSAAVTSASLRTADISAAITTGMQINRLDELMKVALSAQPTAGSMLADLTEDNAGTQRFTSDALANSPSGGATTAAVSAVVASEMLRMRLDELFLNALSAQPAAGSFLGDLTEDNAGTQRFTSAALANAPSGGGGGVTTAALQAELANLNDLSAADVSAAVWGAASRTLTGIDNQTASLSALVSTVVLTTAMTEAYAADGAAPTLTQAVMGIQQFLQERAVSGTALTVKKLDGSSTAMTFTLNTATAATSITRTG